MRLFLINQVKVKTNMTANVEIHAISYCRYWMDAREFLQAKGIDNE